MLRQPILSSLPICHTLVRCREFDPTPAPSRPRDSSKKCRHKIKVVYIIFYLLNSHHRIHELARIANGNAGKTAIPIHEIVVDVTANVAEHVSQKRLVPFNYRLGNASNQERRSINLNKIVPIKYVIKLN